MRRHRDKSASFNNKPTGTLVGLFCFCDRGLELVLRAEGAADGFLVGAEKVIGIPWHCAHAGLGAGWP